MQTSKDLALCHQDSPCMCAEYCLSCIFEKIETLAYWLFGWKKVRRGIADVSAREEHRVRVFTL